MSLAPKTTARMDKMVQAAGVLFARQGYHGTSTREIAHLAEVSENTLFRNFENKEDLFWATLRAYAEGLKLGRDLQQGIAKNEPLDAVLPKIVELLTDTANFRPELPRLIAVAFLELSWKADAFCQDFVSPALGAIQQYLAGQVKRGEMRDLDPTMATAALTSMVLLYPGLARMIGGGRSGGSEGRKAARTYTKFWLAALSPSSSASMRRMATMDEEQSA
jgi:AcrR family transcriptional regulator